MEFIIGRGTERDRASLNLYTTSNQNRIENERPDQERSIEALRAARRYAKQTSPSATCRSLTAMYNCVGLVFASRRTVVDCKHLELILQDDGYRPVTREKIVEGDVVVYHRANEPQHVGIVFRLEDRSPTRDGSIIQIWILSQWGEDGEYIHKLEEVPPIYGDVTRFWSERKEPT
jgi:hypothetical protein